MHNQTSLEAIATTAAPAAIGPYSQGVRVGDLLFISGQLPLDPETGEFVAGGIEAKTHQVIKNIRAIVETAGGDLSRVVKTTVFLKDMKNFVAMNKVYETYFGAAPPARSAVQVAALPKDADIEIEAIAHL
ncbi:RidA family protein [Desulfococcaceae bacterium HSG9]|nr:RidA family protein [Desulfococcaceae bacterium HSG9]